MEINLPDFYKEIDKFTSENQGWYQSIQRLQQQFQDIRVNDPAFFEHHVKFQVAFAGYAKEVKATQEKYNGLWKEAMLQNPDLIDMMRTTNAQMRQMFESNPFFADMERFGKQIEAANLAYGQLLPTKEVVEAVQKYFEQHTQLARDIPTMAQNGWYFSVSFIDGLGASDLKELFLNNPVQFEEKVLKLFEETLESFILAKLVYNFPKRKAIFECIVERHKNKDYYSSVTLALTQADGICKDVFVADFGKKKGKQPVGFFTLNFDDNTKIGSQALATSFDLPGDSFFMLLTNQLARGDRNQHVLHEKNSQNATKLNRHAILHGESVDFGSYRNSIQAILVLDFIVDLYVMDETVRK